MKKLFSLSGGLSAVVTHAALLSLILVTSVNGAGVISLPSGDPNSLDTSASQNTILYTLEGGLWVKTNQLPTKGWLGIVSDGAFGAIKRNAFTTNSDANLQATNIAQSVFVPGSNVTFTTNGNTKVVTVASSGGGGSGDVEGPASSGDGDIALFDGTTGKLLKVLTEGAEGTFLNINGGNAVFSTNGLSLNINGGNITEGTVPDAALEGANPTFGSVRIQDAGNTNGFYIGQTNNAFEFGIIATNLATNITWLISPTWIPTNGIPYLALSASGTNVLSQIQNGSTGAVFTANGPNNTPAYYVGEMIEARRNRFEYFDDYSYSGNFSASVPRGNLGWLQNISGTGAAVGSGVISTTGATNAPGEVLLETGTTSTGYGGYTAGVSILFGGGAWTNEWRIWIPTLPDGTESFALRLGFLDTTTGTVGVDGAHLLIDQTTPNFQFVATANSSVTSITNTTEVVAATWYRIKIGVNHAGNSATMWVNDADPVSLTALPTGASRYTAIGAYITKSLGTLNRTALIDYTFVRGELNR